jgi:hypothetical protein
VERLIEGPNPPAPFPGALTAFAGKGE